MARTNELTYYGKPIIGIGLGVMAVAGLVLALGGETFRSEHGTDTAVLTVHWIAILYLAWLAFELRQSSFTSPKVRKFYADELLILTNGKPWIGNGVAVSLFQQQSDGLERLICAGEVINIQANGLVQIRLVETALGVDQDKIADHIQADLTDVVIKPGLAGGRGD